mgnify:CR=1 FL=1
MIIQLLAIDDKIANPLRKFFHEKNTKLIESTTFETFFNNCTSHPSNVFIIQSNITSELQILGFIKDLRSYFGTFPSILIIGRNYNKINTTNFLNVGADNFFEYPYDLTIIEDFLGHRFQKKSFRPIDYRNVPSGGSPSSISRPIRLTLISSNSISFNSFDFITRGSIINFPIGNFVKSSADSVRCKVLSSSDNSKSDDYSYIAEYFEIDNELKKEIRFALKQETT